MTGVNFQLERQALERLISGDGPPHRPERVRLAMALMIL
jgi:hypothetical protein